MEKVTTPGQLDKPHRAFPEGFDPLALDNQLCFPLYAASHAIVKSYGPHLAALDLTYTQYIAMMVLWEERTVSVGHLGERLRLDSGTLTPLLKKLEAKELVTRRRSQEDERRLDVTVTEKGMALRERAKGVPECVASCINLTPQEIVEIRRLLDKIMVSLDARG